MLLRCLFLKSVLRLNDGSELQQRKTSRKSTTYFHCRISSLECRAILRLEEKKGPASHDGTQHWGYIYCHYRDKKGSFLLAQMSTFSCAPCRRTFGGAKGLREVSIIFRMRYLQISVHYHSVQHSIIKHPNKPVECPRCEGSIIGRNFKVHFANHPECPFCHSVFADQNAVVGVRVSSKLRP